MKTFLHFVLTRSSARSILANLPLLFFISLGALSVPTELSAAGSFRFEETGSLSHARKNHSATLLPDGKVLVAGGNAVNVQGLASAELYDQASGVWTTTGNLVIGRAGHTATLLTNGKVLVAGGVQRSDRTIPWAELYDPAQGTWTETGKLITPRSGHTATLLADGRVLVAGGSGENNGNLSSAELYDPATGTWTATGSLSVGRFTHTATLLPNGLVLVAGGANTSFNPLFTFLASAELYDSASGVWTNTGSLITGRQAHTATLLDDGMVLVVGGLDGQSSNGGYAITAELYNPSTGIWNETGDLVHGRAVHTAIVLSNGKVLVAGGAGFGFFRPLASVEIYDPASGIWSDFGRLITAREGHTATLLAGGDMLVTGGDDGRHITFASAERGTR